MTQFDTPFGTSEVQRYPKVHDQTLMPFDHADKMLLNLLHDKLTNRPDAVKNILVVNDEFGAISCPISDRVRVSHWSDSLLSQIATQRNLAHKNNTSAINFYGSTETLPTMRPDLILMRLPKNLNYFRQQLKVLAHIYPDTPVWFGIMQKFITPQVKKFTEQFCTDINAGRAEKKARVIKARFLDHQSTIDKRQTYDLFSDADTYKVSFDEQTEFEIVSLPNVFSANSLDIGSRFFLSHFPNLTSSHSIGDLGSGNGLLSIYASYLNPTAKIVGYDESYQAVASAIKSAEINKLTNLTFSVSNCAAEAPDNLHDTIICNPPFHQQRRVTTDTAHYMFEQARRILSDQGSIWVIANRHLNYHVKLRKIFGNATVLASNPRFVILSSTKTMESL